MKKYIVCLLAIVWLWFLTTEADALSVQVRGGTGIAADSNYSGIGLNVFVYEGGNMDIFLGAEQTTISSENNILKYSLNFTTYNLGLRFKPTTSWRIKPYFLGEFLSFQNVKDDLKFKNTSHTLISKGKPEGAGKLGVGTDIGISDSLTLGVEAFVLSVRHTPQSSVIFSTPMGNTEHQRITDFYYGINLGLRYSF